MPTTLGMAKDEPKSQSAVQAPQSAVSGLEKPISEAAAAAQSQARRPSSVGVSADLKMLADRAMAADQSLNALLQGASYTVSKEGPWTRVKSEARIGVVREIQLSRVVNTPVRQWPVIVWDKSTDTYQRHQYNASYRGVSQVTVFIDDVAGVVQLSPGPEATFVEGPGNEWKKSLPAGSGD